MKIKGTASRGFLFDSVKIKTPDRSAFDLSFENRLSLNMGKLVPTMCQETLPNDDFNLSSSYFARFAPVIAPVMQKIDIMVYSFFVPNRIIWSGWEEFISPGAGKVVMRNQPQYVPPIKPWFTAASLAADLQNIKDADLPKSAREIIISAVELLDYLGYGHLITVTEIDTVLNNKNKFSDYLSDENLKLDALPILAYFKIYDDYVRDENLEEPVDASSFVNEQGNLRFIKDLDGELYYLFLRTKCWEKDYFTSSLPDPQRGAEVYLPIGESAPIEVTTSAGNVALELSGDNEVSAFSSSSSASQGSRIAYFDNAGQEPGGNRKWTLKAASSMSSSGSYSDGQVASVDLSNTVAVVNDEARKKILSGLKVDLSSATSITIETLRASIALQEFLEKSARTGARYCENMLAEFGQSIEDSRLNRAEFIGGRRIPVNVSDVMQTANNYDSDGKLISVTGDYSGKLISSGSNYDDWHSPEHGWIIQLVCCLPRTAYCQGMPRKFTRQTYLDYAFPEFANLGEQEIKSSEIFFEKKSQNTDKIFGYTPRYAEYKYNYDETHGDFTDSLSFWTMTRRFSSVPRLNNTFVHCQPSTDIFAVSDDDVHHIYLDVWHDIKCLRCLPLYGTPHF